MARQFGAKGVAARAGAPARRRARRRPRPPAGIRHGGEARRAGHRRRGPARGYKARIAAGEGAGLARGAEVATANVRGAARPSWRRRCRRGRAVPAAPARPRAGRPSGRSPVEAAGRARCGPAGVRGRGPEALARLEAHNARVRRVRRRIEKVSGTWKRSYGLRRMRRLGLAKAGLQARPAAMAHYLRRAVTLLHAAAA